MCCMSRKRARNACYREKRLKRHALSCHTVAAIVSSYTVGSTAITEIKEALP